MNRNPTIYDLAEKLNLSTATISRALNNDPRVKGKTIKKVQEAAAAIGYQRNPFASNLRIQKTNTIGVIVPRLASHFMSSVISGIEIIANKAGYNIIISQSNELTSKEIANVRTMFDNRVDGLLVSLTYQSSNLKHFKDFFNKEIPVIFFDRVLKGPRISNITIDNESAAYEATQHLINQGCSKIIHVTANITHNVYEERYKGYRRALKDAGIKYDETCLILNDLSYEAGHEAASVILNMKRKPDGVFVANDTCATGCMMAIKKSGIRIPEDMAFVGFNNDPVSTIIEPQLTTINYSGYNTGQVAIKNLLQQLEDAEVKTVANIVLQSDLVIRQSSLFGKGKK